jgi:hypothetical protein
MYTPPINLRFRMVDEGTMTDGPSAKRPIDGTWFQLQQSWSAHFLSLQKEGSLLEDRT